MQYFLCKADPDHDYSIEDLQRDGQTIWDGVHNAQALINMRLMKPEDQVFIYHSQKQKAVVGLAEVAGEPYENLDDPRKSWAFPIKFVEVFKKPITLAAIKQNPWAADFALVRQGRLSVVVVSEDIAGWLLSQTG